ncbi:4'-phosphopantetheinyl transferase family protein [Mucilaginibacter lappiensis]|uniref:4'-phosphopantetheinyl transferase n=1 Tax=Mucilaginibacter lappiensis TaxID=354630 RepID=A0A841JGD5_9SPHI|nr:4'-phosphopantetheinyl transferase superfamily protein [Mucilaginibacter lappiensis]MBB6127525.1 4'-phosphopantetheinyl transferase [Mucilaginibacter lappiensis]
MCLIKVHIKYQDDISWQNGAGCDYKLKDGQVDVWRIRISSNLVLIDDFFKVLLPDEIIRANRYVQKKDKLRFVVSRGALRCLLSKYTNQPATAIKFVISANKKPYIQQQNLKYNVSHAGDWVLIAISNTEVGVDTEEIDHSFSYKEILADYFSKDEINYIAHQGSSNSFFLLWTRKEALTKATAIGLDNNLKHIPSLNGDHELDGGLLASSGNWKMNSFKTDENNMASLATEITAGHIMYWDVNFEKFLPGFKQSVL